MPFRHHRLRDGAGRNVFDVDGNRYVDLAAGFGALLLGHGPRRASAMRSSAGGVDCSSSRSATSMPRRREDRALASASSAFYPEPGARVMLGASGRRRGDGRAQDGGPRDGPRRGPRVRGRVPRALVRAARGVRLRRESYREPFAGQLNEHVAFAPYPRDAARARARFAAAEPAFSRRREVGAVLVEPILGRGGCVVPPPAFSWPWAALARRHGALLVCRRDLDGARPQRRDGFASAADGVVPDFVCLGKGLGGGLPISACIGAQIRHGGVGRDPEVVHTSTIRGAPLASATALATLDVLSRERLAPRAAELGRRLVASLRTLCDAGLGVKDVRGEGLMVGIDLGPRPGVAARAAQRLLKEGYLVSTGGGGREVIVLTPPLTIAEPQLFGVVAVLREVLKGLPS